MEDYSTDKQRLFIHYLLKDAETFTRCMNIIKPEYFDQELRKVVKFVMTYAEKHRKLPPKALIVSETGTDYSSPLLNEATESDILGLKDWFLKDFEYFCKRQALTKEILNAASEIEKGHFEGIDSRIKEALLISLNKELGTNYFEDPKGRLSTLLDKSQMTPTGWKVVDEKLYGGLNRGEITIFAGNSGMGKSLFLQNITLNWAKQKKNVIYFTFELSEVLTSMRLDAMMSGYGTRDVVKNLDSVHHIIKRREEEYGSIQIKYMPPGTNSNDLRAYIKEYQIQTGVVPDGIAVDYLDLMHPCNKKINPSDMFIKDKYVTEELRALAAELGILCVTASQLNRSAVDEQMHDMGHIAGGISKVNTADNVITIYTSVPMRERGEYRLQFIKTRSSSGVGSTVHVKFNDVSLRITDPDDDSNLPAKNTSSLQDEIRAKLKNRTPTPAEPTSETKDTPSHSKVNSLAILNKVKNI